MPDRSRLRVWWPVLALLALLAAGWLIYRPALSGTFLLDDHSNLAGLESVSDADSALHFVLSGDSGPLGRPLALASFLPQASSWGLDATPFIHVNILIHLFNGLLVFLFSWQLARIVLHDRKDAPMLALATTAIWLFMPLLASSSLLIVQRMTTLSATFVLSGLNAYMIAREKLTERPGIALASMSIVLVAFSLLAVFTKENGALLPLFVLVIELALLRSPGSLTTLQWNAWRGIFLVIPALVMAAFVLIQIPYSDDLVARREFTATGRLFSEARILWEYLLNAFFAPGAQLGPFHETRRVNGLLSDPLTIAAVVAWIVAVIFAVRWRKRYPVVTFAVFWFLAGHLLESTTIPLELYFEHRNYLPIIGPIFALCYFVFQIPGRFRVISRSALAAYAVINAGILFGVTSIWGNPLLATTFWHDQNPASVRAATTLASQQLSRMGPEPAIKTLRDFSGRYPQHAYIRIPELNLVCSLRPEEKHTALVDYLRSQLPAVVFSYSTGEMLDQLLTSAVAGNCHSVSPAIVGDLAAAVMQNPRYRASIRYNQFHHTLLARIAKISGEIDKTLENLARAIEIGPSDRLVMMIVTTLVAAERFEEARQFIVDSADDMPQMPLKRFKSKRNLVELKTYVDESEKLAEISDRQGSGD